MHKTIVPRSWLEGPKGFFVAGLIITLAFVPVFVIAAIAKGSTAAPAAVTCDRACQKHEFIQQHIASFQSCKCPTPDALYGRGRMEARAKDWYAGTLAKLPPQRRAAFLAAAPSADAWWHDFLDGANCAITHNVGSCIQFVQSNPADHFVDIFNTDAYRVFSICGVPTVVAAGLAPEAPWAAAGAAGLSCFWGWYYEKTH